MRPLFLALGVLTLAVPVLSAPTPPASGVGGPGADLPIRRVTLYTSGVGYFERSGAVDGDATQTLLFPVGQVNDVLKSLVLLDGGGGNIRPVTYAAQDPLGRQLQSFSVDLSDNPDRATLLNRLRGTPVTVTFGPPDASQTVTGTIVGVETQTVTLPNGGGTTQQSTLNLAAEDGLRSVALASITALKIDDPKVAAELSQALSVVAQGRDAGKRPVRLAFSGRGRRSVTVGYLTEAPLWQTTYRLVLGKAPVLQGWALVQNTGQDDWNGVGLTLVSGRPISFIQDLYTPQYVPRPTVQPRVAASPTPQTYAGNLQEEQAANAPETPPAAAPAPATPSMGRAGGFGGGGFGGNVNGMAADSLSRVEHIPARRMDLQVAAKQSLAASGATLGTALFTYQIKVPVSVPRQQSAMIPFVSGGISAQPVAIFNPQVQADHPLSGARLKNTTGLHLMGGPLTVFDEGGNGTGYVGDALMDDTEPGQTRLISYALDLAVDAHSEEGAGSGTVVSLVITQSTLQITRKEQQSTIYTLKNNGDRAQTVVIEHPYQGDDWKLLEPKAATERTAAVLRFDVPLAAKASQKFVVREEHPDVESIALLNTDPGPLLVYIRSGQASAAVKAALQEVLARRRAVAETQARIADLDARVQALAQGQARIRENMKALDHTSALYRRYVGELDAQETKLGSLQAEKDTLQAELAQKQAALNEYVAHLSVE
ncbi:MAG: hypothetical protein JO250_22990 [Armatimonadetes bacterium]|nr:hypothetical protein [Armatimonadota bacterium]